VWTNGQRLVATSTLRSEALVWRQFPAGDGQPPDFHLRAAWLQGEFFRDGRLALLGRTLHVWRAAPEDDGESPALSIRGFEFAGGDGSDMAVNRVYIWEGIPLPDAKPKFVLPVERPGRLAADGTWLVVTPLDGPSIQAFRSVPEAVADAEGNLWLFYVDTVDPRELAVVRPSRTPAPPAASVGAGAQPLEAPRNGK
jgi:hypothetical protein